MLNLLSPFKTLFSLTRKKLNSFFSNTSLFVKRKVDWQHHTINLDYASISVDYLISIENIRKFLDSLDTSKNYILVICILSEQGMHMAPKSRIENINYKSSDETLFLRVNFEISTIIARYDISSLNHVVFRYREFVSETIVSPPTHFKKSIIPIPFKTKNNLFTDYYAPFSLDKRKFGKLIKDDGSIKRYLYKNRFIIEREFSPVNDTEFYNTKILNINNDDLIIKFVDMKINYLQFVRSFDGYKLHINAGKIEMFESTNEYKNILPLNPDIIEDSEMNNFLTYDLECYLDEENKFVPYAAAWYKNGAHKTYYSSDFDNHNHMILESFRDIIVKENKNCSIYIHNNKRFDSIFIINALLDSEFKILPLYKDDLALSLTLVKDSGTKNPINVIIKDSYLVLPSKLKELCEDFNVETQKSIFPHLFACYNNLNYVGNMPPFESYPEDSFENQDKYKELFNNNKVWNFREEALKYLIIDVKSLYEVVLTARKTIYEKEGVDLTKVISNASLSFRIFRTKYFSQIPIEIEDIKFSFTVLEWQKITMDYLPKIAIFTKKEFNYMVKAYFGGVTEVFKPFIEKGFYYDVNSLYPFVMKNLMPLGAPSYSTDKNLDNYFGVVTAEITTPNYLKYPVLPLKCQDGKNRFVLGNWTGTYCSEELKFARDKFDYKIKVIDGYKFEKGYLFGKFVDHFYYLKNKYKGTALGTIYKLILNSLYGRFGMTPVKTKTEILEQYETEQILFKHEIINIRDLGNGRELVTYELSPRDDNNMETGDYIKSKLRSDNQETFFNTNVAISLFISSYARMYMFEIISKYDLDVYYMDTDSLILDKPLPHDEVSDIAIGKFKLDYKIYKGIHAGLKTYIHHTNNPKKPIVVKAKGAGKNLTFNDFENLIKLQIINYPKEKWFIDKTNLSIEVKIVPLQITGGTNKRRMIIKNGNWIDTDTLHINEIPKNNANIMTIRQDLLPLLPLNKYKEISKNVIKLETEKPAVYIVDPQEQISKDINNLEITEDLDDLNLINYEELDDLSLLSYKELPEVIVTFPSDFELKRLYPNIYSTSRFVIVLNSDRTFYNFYKSIRLSSLELKMTHRTIEKYVNTGILYRNFFLFTNK